MDTRGSVLLLHNHQLVTGHVPLGERQGRPTGKEQDQTYKQLPRVRRFAMIYPGTQNNTLSKRKDI